MRLNLRHLRLAQIRTGTHSDGLFPRAFRCFLFFKVFINIRMHKIMLKLSNPTEAHALSFYGQVSLGGVSARQFALPHNPLGGVVDLLLLSNAVNHRHISTLVRRGQENRPQAALQTQSIIQVDLTSAHISLKPVSELSLSPDKYLVCFLFFVVSVAFSTSTHRPPSTGPHPRHNTA